MSYTENITNCRLPYLIFNSDNKLLTNRTNEGLTKNRTGLTKNRSIAVRKNWLPCMKVKSLKNFTINGL